MQRFKSPEQVQHFLSSHAMIYGHFRPRQHLMTAIEYRNARAEAFGGVVQIRVTPKTRNPFTIKA